MSQCIGRNLLIGSGHQDRCPSSTGTPRRQAAAKSDRLLGIRKPLAPLPQGVHENSLTGPGVARAIAQRKRTKSSACGARRFGFDSSPSAFATTKPT